MDDVIKIVRSLENSSLLIDGATETIKHEIKNQESEVFCAIADSFLHLWLLYLYSL